MVGMFHIWKVKILYYLRITTQSRVQVWPLTTHHSPLEAKQALQGPFWVHPSTALYR